MKFVILGSCVTRDMLRVAGVADENIIYYARTSLISLMSEPLKIDEKDIILPSPFQRKMIMRDFNKSFFEEMIPFEPNIIILDFIDERFDLLRFNNSYVTKSKEFESGMKNPIYDFEPISRNDESTHQFWEKSCLRFIDKLNLVNESATIYIHEAYWASVYLDGHDHLCRFPYQNAIDTSNRLLKRYYDFIKKNMTNIRILKSDCIASEKHIWGLSAYHYTDEYYLGVYQQLGSMEPIMG